MAQRFVFLVLVLAAAPALAQEGFRHGRVRAVEPGVTLQRAPETGAEEAVPNLPFLPGDRVWTDGTGRAEFQFADGSVLRLDSASKLDYVAHEQERGGERIVLRLWSGGLYLRNRDIRGFPDFGVETPAGVVETAERGVYRIDVEEGETRLSVYEGEATLESGRVVRVGAGERAYTRRGETPEGPRGFDRAYAEDEFARWDAEREEHEARTAGRAPYLPEDIAPYAGELESNGSWRYEAEVGHVWRPYVAPEWRPYYDGRWVWTAYGWTWVPFEPWGWAPFHYGRWGHSGALGWYWIPGRTWGPAWVSWALGPEYVGWCPLGYRDRPVLIHERGFRGRAVPRGSVLASASPWVYVRRAEIGSRELARRRFDGGAELARQVRVLETPSARLTRDVEAVQGERAMPRTVRTKPTIGDTVPELRSDPTITIPFPTARRRPREPEEERPSARDARIRNDRRERSGDETREPSAPRGTGPRPGAILPPSAGFHPTDARSPARPGEEAAAPRRPRYRWTESVRAISSPETSAERPAAGAVEPPGSRRREERAPRTDADREVLRPLFRPLAQPRPEPEAERAPRHRPRAEGEVSRGAPRETAAPRHEAPRAQPRPEPQAPPADGARAVRRPRKDNH